MDRRATHRPRFRLLALASLTAGLLGVTAVGATRSLRNGSGLGESSADPSLATDAERLASIRIRARTSPSTAALEIRALDPARMEAVDRDAWYSIARSIALRTGDGEWLESLKGHEVEFSDVHVYRVLLAGGLLEEGRVEEAKGELALIEDLEAVNVRDRRRVYALEARIAWLEGDAAGERAAVEKIVHELQYWDTPSCQRCHSDASHPEAAPLLDVRSAWYAQRFVSLMEQQGDGARVRDDAQDALAGDPSDLEALLRLAYASMALGQNEEAQAAFERVPWMRLPGREGGTPRMMMPYP